MGSIRGLTTTAGWKHLLRNRSQGRSRSWVLLRKWRAVGFHSRLYKALKSLPASCLSSYLQHHGRAVVLTRCLTPFMLWGHINTRKSQTHRSGHEKPACRPWSQLAWEPVSRSTTAASGSGVQVSANTHRLLQPTALGLWVHGLQGSWQ